MRLVFLLGKRDPSVVSFYRAGLLGIAIRVIDSVLRDDEMQNTMWREGESVTSQSEFLGAMFGFPARAGGYLDPRTNMPGTNLISIRKRLADTTVELPSGGSMMIAGLVRDDIRQAINGLPGLKDLPVLGTLFRSRDFVRNETELVVIVTPYLVKPVARSALARPDDNFNAASDGAANFLGQLNRVYGTMQTNKPNGRYHGVVGYIYK